jgi:hypothetical protein
MTLWLTPSSLDAGGQRRTPRVTSSRARIRWWTSEDTSERRFAQLKNLVSTVRSCPSAPDLPDISGVGAHFIHNVAGAAPNSTRRAPNSTDAPRWWASSPTPTRCCACSPQRFRASTTSGRRMLSLQSAFDGAVAAPGRSSVAHQPAHGGTRRLVHQRCESSTEFTPLPGT